MLASWGALGRPLGGLLGRLGCPSGGHLGRVGALLGRLGGLFGPLARFLGSSWPVLLRGGVTMRILRWPRAASNLSPPPMAFLGAAGPLVDSKMETGDRTGETKGKTTNDNTHNTIQQSSTSFTARPQGLADFQIKT